VPSLAYPWANAAAHVAPARQRLRYPSRWFTRKALSELAKPPRSILRTGSPSPFFFVSLLFHSPLFFFLLVLPFLLAAGVCVCVGGVHRRRCSHSIGTPHIRIDKIEYNKNNSNNKSAFKCVLSRKFFLSSRSLGGNIDTNEHEEELRRPKKKTQTQNNT
jgi:hypothetical protein